jgi:uncharacterized integral membrane protein
MAPDEAKEPRQAKGGAAGAISKLKLGVVAVILVLVAVFMLLNTETVKARFIFAEVETSVAVLMLLSAVIGYVAGFLTARLRRRK